MKLKTTLIGNLVLLSTLILPVQGVKAQNAPNANAYPQEIKEAFMGGCTDGKGAEFEPLCSCMLSEFEKKFTLEEFLEFSMSLSEQQGDKMSPETEATMNDIFTACYDTYPQ
jgi:hypothetical protein